MTRWILAALLLCASYASAQVYGSQGKYITLQASTTITATTVGNSVFGLGNITHGSCVLDVTAVAGASPSVTVYIQGYPDGTNVHDYASFAAMTGTGRRVIGFLTTGTPATGSALTDGTGTANQTGAGTFGDHLRVKAVFGGTTTSFTYSVTCYVAAG